MKTNNDHYIAFLVRVSAGEYQGTDPEGNVWRVVQIGSSKWIVYRDRLEVFEASSLGEGRDYVSGEVRERLDPDYAARMARIRAKTAERKAAEPR